MPPASRGVCQSYVYVLRPQTQRSCLQQRRNISIQKPRDPRNFPTKARSRFRAEQDSSGNSNAGSTTTEQIGAQKRGPGWVSRFFSGPRWLRERPFLRRLIYSYLVTIPIAGSLMMHFPLQWHRVTGPSMKPTINPDCTSRDDEEHVTWCLVQRHNPNARLEKMRQIEEERYAGDYNRGDLVVYHTPHDPHRIAVKRVVGVPGDTVVPLDGYVGGTDPVTVQYHHYWVEGDVNDRKKSWDSNWFGTISEAMIRGKVIALWSPWWNILGLRRPDRRTDEWPAKESGRVAEKAVFQASVNPDRLGYMDLFQPERSEAFLRKLEDYPEYMKGLLEQDERFNKTMCLYKSHVDYILQHGDDIDMKERAKFIVDKMEEVFGADALKPTTPGKKKSAIRSKASKSEVPNLEDLSPSFSTSNTVVHIDEVAAQREATERPAKAALKDMVKQTKQLAAQKEREIEDRHRKEV